MTLPLPTPHFRRHDESDDGYFYRFPRKVVHLDALAIAVLGELYRQLLPPGGSYLDLMSSWRSHLPTDLRPARVTGLGMNAEEMADNPQLDDYRVHDLNLSPRLPFDDEQFEAVLCAVSVQYLTQPVAVFREVGRLLKPGGLFIVSFSNRCFPSKAVALWLRTSDEQRVSLVLHYFTESGGWDEPQIARHTAPPPADPLDVVWAAKPAD